MLNSAAWVHTIFINYPFFKYLIVFLGTALGGEIFLITFAFLSAQGLMSLFALVPLSFFGTYFSDLVWFLLGRTPTLEKAFEHRYASPTVFLITETIGRISRGSHFWALVFAKFLFGTRIVTIVYVSKTQLALKKFLHYNAFAVLLWVAVVIPIGYASGLGLTYISHFFENVYATIGYILLIVVIIILLQIWLKRTFTKENVKAVEKERNKL